MSATRGEGSSRSIAQGAAIPAGAPGGNRPGASAGGAAKARPGQGAPQKPSARQEARAAVLLARPVERRRTSGHPEAPNSLPRTAEMANRALNDLFHPQHLAERLPPRVMGRATTAVYNGVMRKIAGEPGPWMTSGQ